MVTKAIERAQKKVEAQNFAIRKHTLEYDDVMNVQRKWIYERRLSALERESIKDEVVELIDDVIDRPDLRKLPRKEGQPRKLEPDGASKKTCEDLPPI